MNMRYHLRVWDPYDIDWSIPTFRQGSVNQTVCRKAMGTAVPLASYDSSPRWVGIYTLYSYIEGDPHFWQGADV